MTMTKLLTNQGLTESNEKDESSHNPEYQPEEISLTEKTLNLSNEASTSLIPTLEASPLAFQVK